MKISDLQKCRIAPFEIEDTKMIKLFSFFLHLAPTIESSSSMNVNCDKLNSGFLEYLNAWDKKSFRIYSESINIRDKLYEYELNGDRILKRNSRGFLCNRHGKETDCQCLLRHIRNSIAHSTVFLSNAGNRKFIMFEDYNKNKRLTAIIILSQTDLTNLKKSVT